MKIIVFVLLLFTQLAASAAGLCINGLNPNATQKFDPVEQWGIWERQYNITKFRQSDQTLAIPYVLLPAERFEIIFLPGSTPALISFIKQGSDIRWFKHPDHENLRWPKAPTPLPYLKSAPNGSVAGFAHTASRSLFMPPQELANQYCTLKLATDHPHGPKGVIEPDKATMKEDINDSIARMKLIASIEAVIGEDPSFIIAKDVALVRDKITGEGYSVRDLSFLKSGHYYLPAFSLPYAGREIAQLHGADPDSFWGKHYAEAVGRLKAKLLLRYGIQMESPNAQNFLIELDSNMMPTGRLVVRDLGDSNLVRSMLAGIGGEDLWEAERKLGIENAEDFKTEGLDSVWHLNEAGDKSFNNTIRNIWIAAHDGAYLSEIGQLLGFDLRALVQSNGRKGWVDETTGNFHMDSYKLEELKKIMLSEAVQQKILEYRQRLQQEHQQQGALHVP